MRRRNSSATGGSMDLATFLTAGLDDDRDLADSLGEQYAAMGRSIQGADTIPLRALLRLTAIRMLGEVDAKRKILALHALSVTKVAQPSFDSFTGDRIPDSYEVTCETCGWASGNPASGCGTLRALAAVWSDHPDYDPAWKE